MTTRNDKIKVGDTLEVVANLEQEKTGWLRSTPKQTQHTPGPWTVDAVDVRCDNMHIAACTGSTVREAKANARLIAAAPDLLAALRDLHAEVEFLRYSFKQSLHNAMARARAAIAAAEGRAE